MKVLVAQSCPTLCDPIDCSPPGSSVHRIFQARILEWIAISFSRVSSQPRDQTHVFCIADRFFAIWTTREPDKTKEFTFSKHLKGVFSVNFFLIVQKRGNKVYRELCGTEGLDSIPPHTWGVDSRCQHILASISDHQLLGIWKQTCMLDANN